MSTRRHITRAQAIEMRRLRQNGLTLAQIGVRFGRDRAVVLLCLRRLAATKNDMAQYLVHRGAGI